LPSSKKKTRKRQYQARPQSARPVASDVAGSSAAPVQAVVPKADTKTTALADEYRYVISDLKRIGITAAAMFAILVVLALIIT